MPSRLRIPTAHGFVIWERTFIPLPRYPGTDFNQAYTYVYYILDIPPEDAARIARIYFDSHERGMSWEEYRENFVEFSKKGGKYVRTLIVHGPESVGWDRDGEEDFWILPVSCDGWEYIEEQIRKRIKDAKSFRQSGGRMKPPKQ